MVLYTGDMAVMNRGERKPIEYRGFVCLALSFLEQFGALLSALRVRPFSNRENPKCVIPTKNIFQLFLKQTFLIQGPVLPKHGGITVSAVGSRSRGSGFNSRSGNALSSKYTSSKCNPY